MKSIMNKTAIVTGVTGQMGSFFAEFLLQQGVKVVGVTRRLSVPNEENIKKIQNSNEIIFELMDLGDTHSINSVVEKHKPDYFINCAANSFVGTSWDCPEQHFEYNCLGVLRQLEAIRKHSPHTRYINFGSSEEFGDVVTVPQDETHPARARSPYGASKIAARQIVKVYRESYNLYAIQCWCFNYESERRGVEFLTRKVTKNVARIYQALSAGESFEPMELGNVDAKRDWSYCGDFVTGVWLMLNQEDSPKEYVLSSNETHSVREFVELAFKAAFINGEWSGLGIDEVFTDKQTGKVLVKINPKFYRPAEVELLLGDSSLARKELSWTPRTSFSQLVEKMVACDLGWPYNN
jgi:GDPmannose 4,6-dehydratase